MTSASMRAWMILVENTNIIPPGWLNVKSGVFVAAKYGQGEGHTRAILRHHSIFGFEAPKDVWGVSEASLYFGKKNEIPRSLSRMADALDGDEGVWQTVYDRGWVRVTSGPRPGIIVENSRVAQLTVRHLTNMFFLPEIDIDLYDRKTRKVRASYRLSDLDDISTFIRYGRLSPKWRTDTMDMVESGSSANDLKRAFFTFLRRVPSVTVDLVVTGKSSVRIEYIGSDVKQKGYGTTVMQQLCDLADKHGVTISLQPVSYADYGEAPGGLGMDDLIMWYEGFGFDYNDDSAFMSRSPQR